MNRAQRRASQGSARKPKVGESYELFAFEKFRALFPEARVQHDDHIVGIVSGQRRQIDVSIRFPDESLIIVSCKDRGRKATLPFIDEFVSVMKEVGAVKGFLMSAPGFARTTHRYALNSSVELVTIEDIRHPRWSTTVTIPVRLNDWREVEFRFGIDAVVNEAVAEAAQRHSGENAAISLESLATDDGGATQSTLGDLLNRHRRAAGYSLRSPGQITDVPCAIDVFGAWQPGVATYSWVPLPKAFYKEVTPVEYAQLVNHGRGTVLPLHVKLGVDAAHGWIEIDPATSDEYPGLHVILDKE